MKKTEGYEKFLYWQEVIDEEVVYPDPNTKEYSFRDMKCAVEKTELRGDVRCLIILFIVVFLLFIFGLSAHAQEKTDSSERIDTIWHGKYVEGGFSYDTVSICSHYRIWVSKNSFLPGESCDYCVFIYHLEGTKKKFIRKVIIDSFSTK